MPPESVYDLRFGEQEQRAKDGVWREIARFLQRYIPPGAVVIDVGADREYFIRHVKGRLPTHPWLVRAYFAFRPAWWILGRQTLYVGERPA